MIAMTKTKAPDRSIGYFWLQELRKQQKNRFFSNFDQQSDFSIKKIIFLENFGYRGRFDEKIIF